MPIPAAMLREVHLGPSILSADFSRLGQQVEAVMDVGIRLIHVDIMDGHFVPNLTIGPTVTAAIAPLVHAKGGFLSVHLMIEEPDRYIDDFARAGADAMSVHVEAAVHLHRTLSAMRESGVAAGIALNPGTDLSVIGEATRYADFVLVMTVNPGFGGQTFIAPALDKVRRLRAQLPPSIAIEVDGGIKHDNIRRVVEAGGNWLVAGSAVYGSPDPGKEASYLQELATQI
jgi:ribulose-phosphate 3-epimerase